MIDWLKVQHAHTIARGCDFKELELPWRYSGIEEVYEGLLPDTKYVATTPYEPMLTTELFWIKPREPQKALGVLITVATRIMGAWATIEAKDNVFTLDGTVVGNYGMYGFGAYAEAMIEPLFTTTLRSKKTTIQAPKRK